MQTKVNDWIMPSCMTIFSILVILAAYHSTLRPMISIWNSNTFAHCYLILPISGYLIWKKRFQLVAHTPYPESLPIIFIAGLGFVWYIGNITDVAAVQQYALVSIIPCIVWAFFGSTIFRVIIFPLTFLLFCVPFGDFLIPWMIGFTADFTVALVRFSNIPIFREGTFFSIPSGDWSVVEACAGLRYFMASIILGTLFAYTNFRSLKLRIFFVTLSAVVPIILNGLRAYLIVMIGHFSGMKLGVGVDHYIYGWVFFGLGMALLFWFGSLWREEDTGIDSVPLDSKTEPTNPNIYRTTIIYLFALLIAVIWPLRADNINNYNANDYTVILPTPKPISPWSLGLEFTKWKPFYNGAKTKQQNFYTNGNDNVGVIFEYYSHEIQGSELINTTNVLVPEKHPIWKLLEEKSSSLSSNGNSLSFFEGRLKSNEQNLLVWKWYWVSGTFVSDNFKAKLLKARDKLFGLEKPEAAIFLVVEIKDSDLSHAQSILHGFVDVMLPEIRQSLDKPINEPH